MWQQCDDGTRAFYLAGRGSRRPDGSASQLLYTAFFSRRDAADPIIPISPMPNSDLFWHPDEFNPALARGSWGGRQPQIKSRRVSRAELRRRELGALPP